VAMMAVSVSLRQARMVARSCPNLSLA
jgi:hypothetical protein